MTIFSSDHLQQVYWSTSATGNDVISDLGEKGTLKGGAGNDTLDGSYAEHLFYLFGENDGQDVITNFGSNSTLKITSGSIDSMSIQDDDVIFHVGTSSVKIKNAALDLLNIIDAKGYPVYNRADEVYIAGR